MANTYRGLNRNLLSHGRFVLRSGETRFYFCIPRCHWEVNRTTYYIKTKCWLQLIP